VPKKFIRSVIAAVDGIEKLRRVSKFDTAEAEAALQFEAAFRPVVDQVAILLASLTYTIDVRLAGVVEKALRACDIGKGLARDGRIDSSSSACAVSRLTSGAKVRKRRRARRFSRRIRMPSSSTGHRPD
jgi:hypothetical protein